MNTQATERQSDEATKGSESGIGFRVSGFGNAAGPQPGTRSPEPDLSRRDVLRVLGAGLVIAVSSPLAEAQQRRGGRRGGGGGGGGGRTVSARIHIGTDGTITVMTGKIEMGQGARVELAQAAAEELHVPATMIQMVMGDTSLVPDDGVTAGSMTTPRTVPPVRQAAATARKLLTDLACQKWGVQASSVEVRDGKITHAASNRTLTYADLAKTEDIAKAFSQAAAGDVTLTDVKEWKVLGTNVLRPNRRELVTGGHQYPSDLVRPNMLRGKILRPPSYGAKLVSIDLAPAKAMKDVMVVQEDQFVGVGAPTTFQAEQALAELAKTAKWEPAPHPSSKEIVSYLAQHAQGDRRNPFADDVAKAAKSLKQTYSIAYVQHVPLETRVALAEWENGKLTVWTGTQAPFGYHNELARTFNLANDQVRVIVPDFGCGFGGKHTGEAAIETARLAKAFGRPVLLKWTRHEEFVWAYFRPAAVIECEAGMDGQGKLTSWHFININAGGSGVQCPYNIAKSRSNAIGSNSPLRQGSYRALGSTGSNFARESFMDELAAMAGADPLEFRVAHLGNNDRLRAVLETAAQRFDWKNRVKRKDPNLGVGLACGTEKGGYVAACAEVAIDRASGRIIPRHVTEVFECGKVLNPDNLWAQVAGCILMGLGPALREEMRFEEGKILNGSFWEYEVPRFEDVPTLDIHLLDRPDLIPAGGGETPIMAIAPAIGNAVFHATGIRLRQMPMRLPAGKPA